MTKINDGDAAIEQYAPLVKYVIRRLAIRLPAVLDYDDVVAYGTMGLIQALARYDETKGVKFEAFAISRIRGAIIDAMRSLDPLSRSVRLKAKRLAAVTMELTNRDGRNPTDAELAARMGTTIRKYNQTLVDCSWVTLSLDGLLDRDVDQNGAGATELPADPNDEDFTLGLEKRELLAELACSVKMLPEREWLIISLYYKEGMTMREIGQILDVSETRVSQMHARALRRLRSGLEHERAA